MKDELNRTVNIIEDLTNKVVTLKNKTNQLVGADQYQFLSDKILQLEQLINPQKYLKLLSVGSSVAQYTFNIDTNVISQDAGGDTTIVKINETPTNIQDIKFYFSASITIKFVSMAADGKLGIQIYDAQSNLIREVNLNIGEELVLTETSLIKVSQVIAGNPFD